MTSHQRERLAGSSNVVSRNGRPIRVVYLRPHLAMSRFRSLGLEARCPHPSMTTPRLDLPTSTSPLGRFLKVTRPQRNLQSPHEKLRMERFTFVDMRKAHGAPEKPRGTPSSCTHPARTLGAVAYYYGAIPHPSSGALEISCTGGSCSCLRLALPACSWQLWPSREFPGPL